MTGTTPAPSAATIAGPLRLGCRGQNVRTLQSLLNAATTPGPGLAVDGIFGMKTDAAVRAFQRFKRLLPDGIAGKLTVEALGAKFVHQPQQPPPIRPDPPGTTPPGTTPPAPTFIPEAFLLSVIAKDLKRIHQRIDNDLDINIDPDDEDKQRNYKNARKFAKGALNQAVFLLANAARGGLGAQFVAAQVNMAILAMASLLAQPAALVTTAAGDPSVLMDVMLGLTSVNLSVAGVVRITLMGELPGGLKAGKRQIQDLLEPIAG